jgi:hypothetical protein
MTTPVPPPPKAVEVLLMRVANIFIVKSIKNSVWYKPGDHITFETAKACCDMPHWEVTMVDNDFWSLVVGKVASAVP